VGELSSPSARFTRVIPGTLRNEGRGRRHEGAMRPSPNTRTDQAFASPRSADLLLAWVDAADDAQAAYVVWRDADRADQADAYCVYRAAIDREEAAARALQFEAWM
jgi:hypothetical protein